MDFYFHLDLDSEFRAEFTSLGFKYCTGRGGDGGRSQLCSGDPHCGWEGTGSMAGAGRRGAGVGRGGRGEWSSVAKREKRELFS